MSNDNDNDWTARAEKLVAYHQALLSGGIDYEFAGQIVVDAARRAHEQEQVKGWVIG